MKRLRFVLSVWGIVVAVAAPTITVRHGLLHLEDAAHHHAVPASVVPGRDAPAASAGAAHGVIDAPAADHSAIHCDATAKESRSPILDFVTWQATRVAVLMGGARPLLLPLTNAVLPSSRAAPAALPRAPPV